VIEGANPRHEHEWSVWGESGLPAANSWPASSPTRPPPSSIPAWWPNACSASPIASSRSSLVAGTDCGFAQGHFVRRLHPSVVWAKLASLTEGARIASQTLASRPALIASG
jgi:5-methyltetrahydropteroyltriglutamate--homocysteine methyltransferase